MAYESYRFKRYRAFGLTPDAAKELTTELGDILDDVAALVENPMLPAAALDDIASPATATAEDVANKLNDLLARMRGSGLLSSE